jgi:NAD(P)H-hydrate repair Nnr-like enzyme with NAD(P)H-hydrate epimerase domain
VQPILTVAEMQAVDAAAQATTPIEVLVERAGTAVAVVALRMLGGAYGRRVVVVAGKGNNGADGRVAAGRLAGRGARVTVVASGSSLRLPRADLVIDAAFGTGFRGEYGAPPCAPGTPVLAVDIPSGVLGDTGEASGSPMPADRTVTFVAVKPGLVQGAGRALAGEVVVADIGLTPGPVRIQVVEDADISDLVPERSGTGNKWDAAVLVVAGSPGMTGAAGLCARAALRAGSGMVRLGVPGGDLAGSPAPEAVGVRLPATGWAGDALAAAERCRAVVVGPGLGRDPAPAAAVGGRLARAPRPRRGGAARRGGGWF